MIDQTGTERTGKGASEVVGGPTFKALDFWPSRHAGGIVARMFFPNGYGASVIRNQWSYGGEDGLYELAVLHGAEGDYGIDYSTPITSDEEGNLSGGAVTKLLRRIARLPAKPTSEAADPEDFKSGLNPPGIGDKP